MNQFNNSTLHISLSNSFFFFSPTYTSVMIKLSNGVLIRFLIGFNCKRDGCLSSARELAVDYIYVVSIFFFLLLYLCITGFFFFPLLSLYRKFFFFFLILQAFSVYFKLLVLFFYFYFYFF